MSQPVLELQGLEISLPRGADRAHAVERVDLTVRPGEIVCLVGEGSWLAGVRDHGGQGGGGSFYQGWGEGSWRPYAGTPCWPSFDQPPFDQRPYAGTPCRPSFDQPRHP